MLLLFPGAFFYHAAVGLNYIGPFFSGYISIVGSICALTLIIYSLLSTLTRMKINKRDVAFYAFMIFYSLTTIYHYIIGEQQENAHNNIILIINLLACYAIFKNINSTDDSYKNILISLSLAMSAIIIYHAEGGAFVLGTSVDSSVSVANYQTMALAYLPPTILSIAKSELKLTRYFLFIVSTYCLFLNGARSEFVAILIFFVAFEATLSKRKISAAFIATAAAITTIASTLLLSSENDDNRTVRLANLSEDNSSNVRDQILQDGLEKILNSPILGDYGNYEPGLYIHNILSAWQDLGIIGFVYFCLMIAIPTIYFARLSLLKRLNSRDVALCSGMLAATIILLLYGKYFAYPLVAITLGIVSSRDRQIKSANLDAN